MTQTIKPPKLKPGDTIGIVSPSWGGAGRFPHRTERGVACLESLGYKVKMGKHALNQRGFVSDSAENRVADLHAMFKDRKVKAIIAAIGGDHSSHLLPLIDFDLIQDNPKIFMGYSDITVLNVALWQLTGLTTFNGPALLTDFAEFPTMFEYTESHMTRVLTQAEPLGDILPSPWWTEERLEWDQQLDLERLRKQETSAGWTWFGTGSVQGPLVGGCIESLQHLRGTSYWPDWDEAILFIETSEEQPSPATVDGILMDYENMGVLSQISGLIVGRPMGYTVEQKQLLRDIVQERLSGYDLPIIMDMDFGHTAPQLTLPLGCRAEIDVDERRFSLLEAAVS
jgi:muramoyltetrapeptide carboxypeptidase LdcA involved in peptidoglycan recycling